MSFLAYFLIALVYVCIGIVTYANLFCKTGKDEATSSSVLRWIFILILPILLFIIFIIALVVWLSDIFCGR